MIRFLVSREKMDDITAQSCLDSLKSCPGRSHADKNSSKAEEKPTRIDNIRPAKTLLVWFKIIF